MKNYGNAMSNIEELRRREGKVMHEIDATKMANHELLGHLKFDRIIYNFPYAGMFDKSMPRETQLRLARILFCLYFLISSLMLIYVYVLICLIMNVQSSQGTGEQVSDEREEYDK